MADFAYMLSCPPVQGFLILSQSDIHVSKQPPNETCETFLRQFSTTLVSLPLSKQLVMKTNSFLKMYLTLCTHRTIKCLLHLIFSPHRNLTVPYSCGKKKSNCSHSFPFILHHPVYGIQYHLNLQQRQFLIITQTLVYS